MKQGTDYDLSSDVSLYNKSKNKYVLIIKLNLKIRQWSHIVHSLNCC